MPGRATALPPPAERSSSGSGSIALPWRSFSTVSLYGNAPQQLEIRQHLTRAQHYRSQRIVGNRNRQPGFFTNAPVQILNERSSPGQYNSAIANVGAQLRRRSLERHTDGVQNRRDTVRQRF